jgi:hypothetical protein
LQNKQSVMYAPQCSLFDHKCQLKSLILVN